MPRRTPAHAGSPYCVLAETPYTSTNCHSGVKVSFWRRGSANAYCKNMTKITLLNKVIVGGLILNFKNKYNIIQLDTIIFASSQRMPDFSLKTL